MGLDAPEFLFFQKGEDMVITSVERNKKNNRLSIYIDNHYAFSITEEDFLSLNLYEMGEISEEQISHIKGFVNVKTAKSDAVRYLSQKVRCENEVRTKLDSEGYDSETVESVLEELKSIGYINDKIYAQKYLYDRNKLKPISKKLLRFELQKKGVAEEIIDEVIVDWDVDEAVVAEGLVKRKFGKYDLTDEKNVKKIYSFLHHRGFSFELIDELVNKIKRGVE